MAKRLETDRGELGDLDRMDGRTVRGRFNGRVRVKGRKVTVDLSAVDVETENSADLALRRLTGARAPAAQSTGSEDDEDDI